MNQTTSKCVLSFPVFDQLTLNMDMTVHAFLVSRLVDRDCALLEDYFLQGFIQLNGRQAEQDQILKSGDKVLVTLPHHTEQEVNTGWKRLWENDELMAVYKPPLLPVSRTTRNLYNTLISLIRRETPYADAQLLHRLDTETSGVTLIAKNKAADKKWKKQLDTLMSQKIYHAWVHGQPTWETLTYECLLSEKENSLIRSQVYVVDDENNEVFRKPKKSRTIFRVIQREVDRSLIECEILTGRKHQIRAQLAHLGHPVEGDKVYAHEGAYYLKRLHSPLTEEDYQLLGGQFHRLSAVCLELRFEDEVIKIESIMP